MLAVWCEDMIFRNFPWTFSSFVCNAIIPPCLDRSFPPDFPFLSHI